MILIYVFIEPYPDTMGIIIDEDIREIDENKGSYNLIQKCFYMKIDYLFAGHNFDLNKNDEEDLDD